jgi:hypothetical protein
MSFECPECTRVGSLGIVASIDLPSDVRSDEIVLQVLKCGACGFRGMAIYEESRRGALDIDTWEHTGYRVSELQVDSVHEAILLCPDPAQPSCRCEAHRMLGPVDDLGRWQAPEGISGAISFPMRLSAPGA